MNVDQDRIHFTRSIYSWGPSVRDYDLGMILMFYQIVTMV